MYQNGKDTEVDLPQAFAWSYLAAETQNPPLIKHHLALR